MEADQPLRILIVEDLSSDAELAERELRKEGISFTSVRVETKDAFLKALEDFRPDLIISDFALPKFDGMQALKLSLEYDPLLPFIVLTGSMNEDIAVACMRAGATDYVIKEHVTRLPFTVREALEQKKERLIKEESERALRESGERYRTLFEESVDSICLAEAETGMIIDCNQALEVLVGRKREDLIGQPQTILYTPHDDKEIFS
ncbi:MAG: response regulator, partial [Syntrophales bacterium]|nr:response regulator [Syntrophales bacterium]